MTSGSRLCCRCLTAWHSGWEVWCSCSQAPIKLASDRTWYADLHRRANNTCQISEPEIIIIDVYVCVRAGKLDCAHMELPLCCWFFVSHPSILEPSTAKQARQAPTLASV